MTLSRLAQIEGDLELAAREIQTAVDLLPLEHPAYIGHEVAAQQVNLNLARRHLEAAQMVLQGQGFFFDDRFVFPDLAPEPRLSHALGLLYNSSLRLLLHLARSGHGSDRLKAGIELAAELIAAALTERQIPIALETTLLRAQMGAALGDHQAAQADYKRALQLAEPEGFIAIFVEQGRPAADALAELVKQNQLESTLQESVTRILAAFSRLNLSQTTPEAPPLIEPLSDREVEVLRLMASGLKYKEIADQLFISLNTVRYHVKALYGKLNVNNRTQAIAAARRQHIL